MRCGACDASFESRRCDQRYCSAACRQRGFAQHQLEESRHALAALEHLRRSLLAEVER